MKWRRNAKHCGRTNQPTNQRTYGPTDGQSGSQSRVHATKMFISPSGWSHTHFLRRPEVKVAFSRRDSVSWRPSWRGCILGMLRQNQRRCQRRFRSRRQSSSGQTAGGQLGLLHDALIFDILWYVNKFVFLNCCLLPIMSFKIATEVLVNSFIDQFTFSTTDGFSSFSRKTSMYMFLTVLLSKE